MRRIAIMATVLAGCGGTKTGNHGGHGPVAAGEISRPGDAPDGEDVLAEFVKMNGGEHGQPPVEFKRGHVTPRRGPAAVRTPRGFEVKFASGAPVTTPAVYRGKVLVSGGFRSKEFHAFNATTGESAWSINLDDDGPSTPACEGRTCVFNTESCTIFAVDVDTGAMKWSWWLGDPLTSSPTIANGIVFTSYPARAASGGKPPPPGATHAVIALDLDTGAVLWQRWLDSDVMSAPVAANSFVYLSTFRGTIIKLEQKTGVARYAVRVRATSAPVIDFSRGHESMYYTRRGEDETQGAEEMLIRADYNSPKTKYKANKKRADYLDKDVQSQADYAAEGSDNDSANGFGGGAPAAANPEAAYDNVGQRSVANMQAFQGSRVLHLGDRNVNTMGDEVIATSAETGETLWKLKLDGDVAHAGGFLGTPPLAAGDSVLFATLAGKVFRVDPGTGKTRTRYDVGTRIRSQPVVADGWIYVGTDDGRLIAIDTGDRSLTGWPMWGGNAARTGIRLPDGR